MKQLLHNLFLPLLAAALCSGACSDDDNDSRPKPSGYDIYTAGYKTPSGKSVATVWKNGSELYALTDGIVNFKKGRRNKSFVSVIPEGEA